MKFTAEKLYEAMHVLTTIINEKRPMPQRGKLALARLYRKLNPDYLAIVEQRNEIVQSLQEDPKVTKYPMVVPEARVPEFQAAWKEIAGEEIEVDVLPIPYELLVLKDETLNGSLEAAELWTLGELVSDPVEPVKEAVKEAA